MFRSLMILGVVVLYSAESFADDGCCSCPECGTKTCIAKPVTLKVKKTVFNIEKKEICIPKFRFPWQMKKNNACGSGCDSSCDSSCDSNNANNCGCGQCAPRCGKIKTVKVLKKKSIECEKCGYEWEITTVATVPCASGCGIGLRNRLGNHCNSGTNCDSSTACDASYFQGANIQPQATTQTQATPMSK